MIIWYDVTTEDLSAQTERMPHCVPPQYGSLTQIWPVVVLRQSGSQPVLSHMPSLGHSHEKKTNINWLDTMTLTLQSHHDECIIQIPGNMIFSPQVLDMILFLYISIRVPQH